jgi:hypothetical protein
MKRTGADSALSRDLRGVPHRKGDSREGLTGAIHFERGPRRPGRQRRGGFPAVPDRSKQIAAIVQMPFDSFVLPGSPAEAKPSLSREIFSVQLPGDLPNPTEGPSGDARNLSPNFPHVQE